MCPECWCRPSPEPCAAAYAADAIAATRSRRAFYLSSADGAAGSVSDLAATGRGALSPVREGLEMLPRLVGEMTDSARAVPLWGQILALLVILAVAQHISLSVDDIKGGALALPLYAVLILLLTAVCGLLGQSAMDTVTAALRQFSGYMTALFTVVLVASLLQLVLALPVWLIRLLTGRAS